MSFPWAVPRVTLPLIMHTRDPTTLLFRVVLIPVVLFPFATLIIYLVLRIFVHSIIYQVFVCLCSSIFCIWYRSQSVVIYCVIYNRTVTDVFVSFNYNHISSSHCHDRIRLRLPFILFMSSSCSPLFCLASIVLYFCYRPSDAYSSSGLQGGSL